MIFFDSSRIEKYPTHYADQHTAAHTDVLLAGILCSIVILIFSLLLILPAFCGWKNKLKLLIKILVATFIGGIIITCNYGHNWEVGKVNIASPYVAATSEEIFAELGISIALRGINITLKGKPKNETGDLAGEIIDYNEHFSWEWAQGRLGFGYYAGRISRDFRAAVLRGTPLPILQMAEYFTFDGEGLRFGRYYRWAGWYTHLLMWAAFPCWIISLIFFQSVVNKGATMMVITGLLQSIAIIIWSTLRNPLEIKVPFESEDQKGEVVLTTKYGIDFYLVFVNSILCTVGGVVIFIVNLYYPEALCNFFGIDVQTLFKDVTRCYTNEEMTKEFGEMLPDVESSNDISRNIPTGHPEKVIKHENNQEETIIVERKRVNSYLGKRRNSHTQRVIQRRSPQVFRRYNYPPVTQTRGPQNKETKSQGDAYFQSRPKDTDQLPPKIQRDTLPKVVSPPLPVTQFQSPKHFVPPSSPPTFKTLTHSVPTVAATSPPKVPNESPVTISPQLSSETFSAQSYAATPLDATEIAPSKMVGPSPLKMPPKFPVDTVESPTVAVRRPPIPPKVPIESPVRISPQLSSGTFSGQSHATPSDAKEIAPSRIAGPSPLKMPPKFIESPTVAQRRPPIPPKIPIQTPPPSVSKQTRPMTMEGGEEHSFSFGDMKKRFQSTEQN